MNYSRIIYCNKDQSGVFAEVDGGTGAADNLKSFGLQIGDEIIFKSKINHHGKIIVESNGKEITLGHELASKILIECTSPPRFSLDKTKVGDIVRVTKMGAKGDVRFRLLDMGLVKGVELTVIRTAPLGDPIEVMINGFYLSLRLEEARGIEVELVQLVRNKKNGKKRWGIF